MSSKFDTLCEEIMKSLEEGKMAEEMPNAGQDAHIGGKEARPETGPNKGHAGKVNEKDDKEVDGDEIDEMDDDGDKDKMEESDEEGCDDDNMDESGDEEDEEMEEGFPNVGQDAHIDGTELHKTKV